MNKFIIYGLIIFGLLTAGYFLYDKHIDSIVQQTTMEIQVKADSQLKALQAKADERTGELLLQIKDIEDAKAIEIGAINDQYRATIVRLSKRPERPASSSSDIRCTSAEGNTTGATGMQLSASDGQFLSRFARDTAELQAELKASRNNYENVRNAIEQFKLENPARFLSADNPLTNSTSNVVNQQ